MAADSKIMIDLELRKDQAEARLRQFEQRAAQQLQRLQAVQARYNANPTAFVKNQLQASQNAYIRRLGEVQGEGKNIRDLQMKIDEESARKGGRLFGLQVNKQTEMFAKQFVGAYIGREVMNIGFAAMYNPRGNNAGLRKAQGTAEGMTTGMQVGAMFGPWGAAIGAATGALLGLASATIKEQKALEAERIDRNNARIAQRIDSGRQLQNTAFDRLLGTYAIPKQLAMLQERLTQVESGRGNMSIKSLEAKLEQMNRDGDHESANYQYHKELLERARREQSMLQQRIFQVATQPINKWTDPSRYADSRAKQGLYSGIAQHGRMIDTDQSKMRDSLIRAGADAEAVSRQTGWINRLVEWGQGRNDKDDAKTRIGASLKKQFGVDADLSQLKLEKPRNTFAGIDFRALNNPVVTELRRIRSTLEKTADRGDRNIGGERGALVGERAVARFGM